MPQWIQLFNKLILSKIVGLIDILSYHPNWHNQILPVESAGFVRHVLDRAGAALERGFVNHAEYSGYAFIRRGGFLDLQRAELPVALQDVDLRFGYLDVN